MPTPSDRLPWYAWPLAPLVLAIGILVMTVLGILALFFLPYFFIYPDRHAHPYDFEGTPRQRELLARRRALYAKMNIFQRIGRGFKLLTRGRQRRHPKGIKSSV
jgi:hypothetical protein